MKKIYKLLLVIMLCISSICGLSACKYDEDSDVYKIFMPDGAPALSMAKLMYDSSIFDYDVEYSVVASNNISNCIIQKTADIAILPVNAASKILGDNYRIVATVTNGNLYVVSSDNVNNLDDLKGKVVGVIGQGNVPDLNLRYLLMSENIEFEVGENSVENKVVLRYFQSAADMLPMLKQGVMNVGLLPEPAVSTLISMSSNYSIKLDIQQLWEGGSYPQAVLVVKKSLCKNNDLIEDLISALEENESWIIDNPFLAVSAINDHLAEGVTASLKTTLSSTAVVNCNINVKSVAENQERERINSYLSKIKSIQSNAVGNYTDEIFWDV
jgi:NitT/TauT family transport system substrate-binding protein